MLKTNSVVMNESLSQVTSFLNFCKHIQLCTVRREIFVLKNICVYNVRVKHFCGLQ